MPSYEYAVKLFGSADELSLQKIMVETSLK